MKPIQNLKNYSCLLLAGWCSLPASAPAGELNHYQPGMNGTRDYLVPSTPGFYYSQMDFLYKSDSFRNGSGEAMGTLNTGRSLDLTRTINGDGGFSFSKSRSANFSVNFQGSNLDLGATLASASEVATSVSINAEAKVQLQAEALLTARFEKLDIHIAAISPTLIWVSDSKFLGARMAAFASVPVVDMSIDARVKGSVDFNARVKGLLTGSATSNFTATTTVAGSLSATGPRGKTVELKSGSASLTAEGTKSKAISKEFKGNLSLHQDFEFDIEASGTDLGDVYVQPLWLGWAGKHYDIAVSDGFYAPTGRYEDGALDNTGLGFWTNQSRLAAAWYPWESKGTAVTVATTYEIHGNKKGVDVRPGSNFTLNWGLSQYIPLNRKQTWLADVGIAGYDIWQVSDDKGSDVSYDAGVHDEVHAVGLQLGLAQAEWNAALTMRWMHEYAAKDRFRGDMFVLNFAMKF